MPYKVFLIAAPLLPTFSSARHSAPAFSICTNSLCMSQVVNSQVDLRVHCWSLVAGRRAQLLTTFSPQASVHQAPLAFLLSERAHSQPDQTALPTAPRLLRVLSSPSRLVCGRRTHDLLLVLRRDRTGARLSSFTSLLLPELEIAC